MSLAAGKVVLALDTSGPVARVAFVSRQGEVLAAGQRGGPRHSATLLPLCHDLLRSLDLEVSQLGAVVCGRGPGSFTGLRVGLALAKGFALAHDLPLLLVSSLEALALDLHGDAGEALVAPCIDAGKGEVYGQLYRGGHALTTELRLQPEAYASLVRAQVGAGEGPVAPDAVLGGTGADRYAARLGGAGVSVRVDFAGPSALALARLALPRLDRGERDDLDGAIPSYGRPPDITTPKRIVN